ncbi:MAG: PssD/Cps14F family polysaccharide biosynthesis glycosyltransferase [Anaerolineae bacterium]
MKLLVVLGSGGHTTEMIRLVDLLGPGYEYCYLVASDDALSVQKIKVPGPVFRVLRPRWKRNTLVEVVIRTLISAAQALRTLVRTHPQAIISTGPGPAVPVSILAKLLGVKVIYIETGSRVFELSTSGRILYRCADLFFVQWPELQRKYPRAIYAGRLC